MNSNKAKIINKLQEKYTNFNIKPYLKSGLSKAEILQLKEAFDLFDINQKGILDINELKEQLNDMGIQSKNEQIDKLIAEYNLSQVDFMNFLNLLGAKVACKNKEEVKKLFFIFLNDDDITKNISLENFQKVVEGLEAEGFKSVSAELTRIPQNTIEVTDLKTATSVMRLIERLEELDDVQNVYANCDIPDEIADQVEV